MKRAAFLFWLLLVAGFAHAEGGMGPGPGVGASVVCLAPVLVQKSAIAAFPQGGAGNTATATLSGVVAGHTITMQEYALTTTSTAQTISVNDGTAYNSDAQAQQLQSASHYIQVGIHSLQNVAAGTHSIVATSTAPSGNVFGWVQAEEWANVLNTGKDQSSTNSSTGSTNPTTGSITPTVPNSLVISAAALNDVSTTASFGYPPAGYTNLGVEINGNATAVVGSADYAVLSTIAAQNPSYATFTDANPWVAAVADYKGCGSGGSSTQIKWHPGHYMESVASASATTPNASARAAEIAEVRAGPSQLLGWVGFYYWNLFEDNSSPGGYSFTQLDNDYVALTGYTSGSTTSAVYSAPRRMMIWINHENYFDSTATDFLPPYLTATSTYGPSPTGGQYGWWYHNGGTGASAAIWRSNAADGYPVMDRLIALGQALAAHVLPDGWTVDTSPYIEAVWSMQSETAALPETSGATPDSTWNGTNYVNNFAALDAAMHIAFPHTVVGTINNYSDTTTNTNLITQNGAAYLTAGADSDTFGYTSGQGCTGSFAGLTWGQCAYIGDYGGSDLRGVVPYIGSVQNTELGYSVTYTPQDVFNQLDETLHATHDLWQNVTGSPGGNVNSNFLGSASSMSQWLTNPAAYGGLLYTIYSNTITHTGCPSAYTAGCNTH